MNLFAYIDPGSGLLIWQMVIAVAVGCLFYLKKVRDGIFKVARRIRGKDKPIEAKALDAKH